MSGPGSHAGDGHPSVRPGRLVLLPRHSRRHAHTDRTAEGRRDAEDTSPPPRPVWKRPGEPTTSRLTRLRGREHKGPHTGILPGPWDPGSGTSGIGGGHEPTPHHRLGRVGHATYEQPPVSHPMAEFPGVPWTPHLGFPKVLPRPGPWVSVLPPRPFPAPFSRWVEARSLGRSGNERERHTGIRSCTVVAGIRGRNTSSYF